MKLFERAIRRAEIPIRMSEGFNPRPKFSYPIALAVGIEGLDEIVEMELSEWVRPSTLLDRLKSPLPPGIEITSVEPISPGESTYVEEVTYRVRLDNFPPSVIGGIKAKIDELLQRREILVYREKVGVKRRFDIRPSIIDITAGADFLDLRLQITSGGMARPEEVILALAPELDSGETDCKLLEITRTKVKLRNRP